MSETAAVPTPTSRRDFVRRGVLTAAVPAALSVLEACKKAAPEPVAAAVAPPAPAKPEPTAREKADVMDAMHEAGIKAFPAKTEGKGNQPLEPRIERGVKVFDLTVEEVSWEVTPGERKKAWAYNGQVPGPQIRVREGDRVRVNVTNKLAQSTAVHFHGVELPNAMDGVPFITQPPIKPGDSYTYEFTAPNAGSHMYHSHHNSAEQVGMGLLGAFIIEPKRPIPSHRADVDYVMILNDGPHGYTLNGKGFPATEPIAAKLGQTIRIRFMNEGMMIHPMHLHGMHMTIITRDGWPLEQPQRCDTLNIGPGERWDVLVRASNPGTWAFHCHILPHAESPHGMYGMVTAVVVK
jgi:FtsP/CotA-like multicopper oxidase with cupredoxin domain